MIKIVIIFINNKFKLNHNLVKIKFKNYLLNNKNIFFFFFLLLNL